MGKRPSRKHRSLLLQFLSAPWSDHLLHRVHRRRCHEAQRPRPQALLQLLHHRHLHLEEIQPEPRQSGQSIPDPPSDDSVDVSSSSATSAGSLSAHTAGPGQISSRIVAVPLQRRPSHGPGPHRSPLQARHTCRRSRHMSAHSRRTTTVTHRSPLSRPSQTRVSSQRLTSSCQRSSRGSMPPLVRALPRLSARWRIQQNTVCTTMAMAMATCVRVRHRECSTMWICARLACTRRWPEIASSHGGAGSLFFEFEKKSAAGALHFFLFPPLRFGVKQWPGGA